MNTEGMGDASTGLVGRRVQKTGEGAGGKREGFRV